MRMESPEQDPSNLSHVDDKRGYDTDIKRGTDNGD